MDKLQERRGCWLLGCWAAGLRDSLRARHGKVRRTGGYINGKGSGGKAGERGELVRGKRSG